MSLVPTLPLRSTPLQDKFRKWYSSFSMAELTCLDFDLLVERNAHLRHPYGSAASLGRQSPCINHAFQSQDSLVFFLRTAALVPEIYPWRVSLQGSRSTVCKKGGSLRYRRGHRPLRNDHKKGISICFPQVKMCACTRTWGEEHREGKGTDHKEFYKWALQLPSKWEYVQHSKGKPKTVPAWRSEPLPGARNL